MAQRNQGKNAKPRGLGASTAVSDILGGGSAKINKKIRDISRLLKKDNLPAHVRVENERTLKALRVELSNTERVSKAKKTAKKYHMVRFFERKKAIRKLKQARKHLEEMKATDVRKDVKKARKVVHHSEVDVAYVVLFPKEEKYISLYPNAKENEDASTTNNEKAKLGQQRTEKRRREFRKQVEDQLNENKLPFLIDDVLEGKQISIDHQTFKVGGAEIDAPEGEPKEDEEDDFFE